MNVKEIISSVAPGLWKVAALGILAAGAVVLVNQNASLRDEVQRNNQNLAALKDSVRVKDGVYYKLNQQFESLSELRDNMPALYREIKGQKGVSTAVTYNTYYSDSTKRGIPTQLIRVDTSAVYLNWAYRNHSGSRSISGRTKLFLDRATGRDSVSYWERYVNLRPGDTDILTDSLLVNITVGIKKNGKYSEIFVNPHDPHVRIGNIEGAVIKEKPKRFGLGVYAGVGANYNPWLQTVTPGVQVGVGVTYNPIRW